MEKKKSLKRVFRRSFSETSQRRKVCWLYGLAAIISIAIFSLFWCTNIFRDAILSNLVIRNGTASFLFWQRPPVSLLGKIYIFNYTNVEEFQNGNADKLKVEEVGPYIYRETLSRTNVQMNDNGTVTYQEKRSYEWVGGESETDRIVVPNMLLMSTLAYSRNLIYLVQIGLTVVLSKLRTETFLGLSVGEYLWGYEDELFKMVKSVASLKEPVPLDKFGILAIKNGLNTDRITMHTGVDMRSLGLIQSVNGLENHHTWGDDSCDRIDGTDGSMFPPQWIEEPNTNSTVYIYAKDVCRSLPFRYERRSFTNGIPTLRYKLPSDIFATNKDSCFCSKESADSLERRCPPAGTFNVSACKQGTPLVVSFPHFYAGDESLFKKIDGLSPRRDRHESYIDLHPRLAVTVNTRLRLQLNLEVRKAVGMPFSGKLEDGLILPLIWVDSTIDDMPESVLEILHRSYYLVNAVEAGFQWCSLVCAVLSFGALIAALTRDDERSSSKSSKPDQRTELDRF
ncbi:scavenger receptor class B member 1-like [Ceratina calcarata]|uniref:Scavenger receptor class B member 1-like n=1 Tax=Ceratina calcarata TaxID=156304 RepID=A0AAJ7J1J2_9HYME|nr:scavenger receptor class B member 1-like [Ceratina calcarata]